MDLLRREPLMDSIRFNQVLEIVVECHWLSWLHAIATSPQGDAGGGARGETLLARQSYLLQTCADLQEAKQCIHHQMGILPQNQRWTAVDGEHFLCGLIFSDQRSDSNIFATERTMHVCTKPPDERLEAFYQMLCLGNVQERDSMMHQMTIPRSPGKCLLNHSPQEMEPLPATCNRCTKCHFALIPNATQWRGSVELKLLSCDLCNPPFAICNSCLLSDQGRPAHKDPYEYLVRHMKGLAFKRASIAGWFGGPGHFCGHPSVLWQSEYGPKRHCRSADESNEKVSRDTQVVHPGARLVVRVSEEVRAAIGAESAASLEVNQLVGTNGASVGDIIRFRGFPSALWGRINTHFQSLHPGYTTRLGEQVDAYTTLELVSYEVEQVVYELGASISDGDY